MRWNDAFRQLCDAGGGRDKQEGSKRVVRFSHLTDGDNGRCLTHGRKEMQKSGKIENVKQKSMPERAWCFSMELATLSGQVAVGEERFVASARNSAVEKGEKKEEQHSSGHVAQRSSER